LFYVQTSVTTINITALVYPRSKWELFNTYRRRDI